MIFYPSLIILVLFFGIQIGLRFLKQSEKNILRVIRFCFLMSVILVFILLFYYSRLQFLLWHNSGPPTQYLVPPFSGIGYFLRYVFTHFWAAYIFSFSVAVLSLFAAKWLNEKFRERFFYPEEFYLLAIGIFLTGHPFWILYLFLVLLIFLLILGFRTFVLKNKERVSFYYLWIPAAILVIIISRWPVLAQLLQILKF